MEALFRCLLLTTTVSSLGAGYRTPNFVVTAPTPELAKQVGDAAEEYRHELAVEWTGKPLPGNWKYPCPINVKIGTMGAGGATTFNFQSGEVYGWKMDIQGSEERILDSVLPHEINHTIFASHFRRPLPRWADEGAASLIEHGSERQRLRKLHDEVLGTSRRIPLTQLLTIRDYPKDKRDVLTLYAEGHSLADFLIQKSSKRRFLKFIQVAHEQGWEQAFSSQFEYQSLGELEQDWEKWVLAGSPSLNVPKDTLLADARQTNTAQPVRDARAATSTKGPLIRGQSPEDRELNSPSPAPPNRSGASATSAASTSAASNSPSNSESATSKTNSAAPFDWQPDPEDAVVAGPLSRKHLVNPVLIRPVPAAAARISHAPDFPSFVR